MAWKHTRDQQPALNLYNADGSHPSPTGTYLAACTFYATLYRTSPVGASYTAGLDPTTAATLQAIAASTVLDSLGTWNIGVNDPDASFTTTSTGAAVSFTPNNAAGSHTWVFGDGATDNATVTTHTYAQSGVYDVLHIVQDACGRVDSTIVPVNVVISSMPEPALPETAIGFLHPVIAQDRIWFTADRSGRFDAFVLTGQQVIGASLAGSQTYQRTLDLPANTLLVWRFTGADGVIDGGRILTP
jgi:PKD repeat protein